MSITLTQVNQFYYLFLSSAQEKSDFAANKDLPRCDRFPKGSHDAGIYRAENRVRAMKSRLTVNDRNERNESVDKNIV